jgi:ABC-2 type transport system permease protein
VEMNEIFYATALMVFSCWLMLGVSGKIFRTAILLYGKKITIREVIKWVRA